MKWFNGLLCLFFLLSASFVLKGQVKPVLPLKKVPVNTINYEQGLLNNETAAIITDTLGFTWASTSTGLQRYNGYTLESIDPVIGRDTIRIRSRVYFCRLKSGNLWISCKKGILEYNPFTNVFKNIIPVDCPIDDVFGILPLSETKDGIWCLKEGAGMIIYSKNGQLKKKIPSLDTKILDGIIRSDYLTNASVIADNQDHIFFRLTANRIAIYDTYNYHFEEFEQPGEPIISVGCNAKFFYTSTPSTLSKFLVSDKTLIKKYALSNLTDQQVRACPIYGIGNNRLLVGLNNKIIELDADLGHPKLLTTFNEQPIITGTVEHIYRDAYDRIWLLTNDDIKRIQDNEIPFSYLKYPVPWSNFVRSLYFDEQTGQLLAGCINGGLQVYDKASNPLWHNLLNTEDVKDVLAIDKLSPNTYLIITWVRGWYLLNLQQKKLSAFNFQANEKFKNLLYSTTFSNNIQRIDDSTILVTAVSNVYRCVFKENVLKSVKPLLPFFRTIDDRICNSYYASDGALWAGQYKGKLYRMSKSGVVEIITLPEKFSIRSFAEDGEHHIWVGTVNGLYVYSLHGKLLKSFYKESGLLNDCIYSLLAIPGKSSVIAGSNMGLSVISLNGNIKNYTKELGLQDNEFNTDAAVRTASGKYYFGGISGITAFSLPALDQSQSKPQLNMTKLVVNDSSYNSSGIYKGDTIRLKYNQNHLQFDFAAMGLLNADKYFYKYRLIGFENHWQSTHQPTDIGYILQPGTYTLEVACSNELSGADVKKNILIIIDPPWWLTWWFLIVVCLCSIGVIILLVTLYNKRQYQKTLQELLLKQGLQTQRERISRDLHDNLGVQANAIFYGTELLKHKNGYEQKLVDNLHDTAGDMLTVLRETLWAMKITEVEAADLWLRVLNFVRKIGSYHPGIKINIHGTPPGNLTINATLALNIILILQEGINNAIRHADASEISLNGFSTDKFWKIEIIDNGKGFDPFAVSKKTENYGLENMAERANESNIAFEINSIPCLGTKISLEIDITKSNNN